MTYSVAIPKETHDRACFQLVRKDEQEDVCFGLWYPSQGANRLTCLISDLILPGPGERHVHGNASFMPEYFERALQVAVEKKAGLALMHSHPSRGWQGMSGPDVTAEQGHAAATFGITGLPLLGLTVGVDEAWSARIWKRIGTRQYERNWCTSVRIVGERLSVTYNEALMPSPKLREELMRTVSAWGLIAQAHLARLHIGIIGCGSVGNIIGESLARMGISNVSLIDFDSVETVNLDRLLHGYIEDAESCASKVMVLARALKRSATAKPFKVDAYEYSIAEEKGFRAALDCDVLFSCVDRPWPRSILNFIAYAHLIPVVDGGLRLEAAKGGNGLKRADWRAHIASVGRPCLECIGQYDSGLVSAEREGYFENPSYIQGLPIDHIIKRNENVFGFSLSVAGFEILQLLAMVIAPLGQANQGVQKFHFVTGNLDSDWETKCDPNCAFASLVARGDMCGVTVTGRHGVAELKRQERKRMNAERRAGKSTPSRIWERIGVAYRAVRRWWNRR